MEATGFHNRLNLLLFLLPFPIPVPSRAADTLGKGRNITGDETLVSAGGTFTMGIFSLGPSSSKRYYLGIWFTVSRDAVCWMANRERRLQDNVGVLVVQDTGSLVLLDGSGQMAWSSNPTAAVASSSVEAQLLDNGNLIVRERSSSTVLLWQSFDHPTNTLLSGMKVGKDSWNGAEWHLTSWRSADDPSPGAYRRVLDTNGLPDNIVWVGQVKKFRTGPWNGLRFSGIPEVLTYTDLIAYQMVISPGETSFGYIAKPGAPLTRVVLTDTGLVRRLVWDASSEAWQTYYEGPRDVCDTYGKCEPFSLCDAGAASTSFCNCVRGFGPASSPSAGHRREASAGCRRKVALDCGGGSTTDVFVVVRGVKLPDTHNASVDTSIELKECRARCRANCSCVAYAAADIRGSGSRCVIWTDDMADLRYVDQGQDLYLRLAKSELDKDFPLAAVVAPVSTIVAFLILFALIWWRRKRKTSGAAAVPQNPATPVPSFDLTAVKDATGDFSERRVVGQGGFAVVYQGELPDGRKVAVKRFKQSALTNKGKEDFEREVEVMSTLMHNNLLRLLAYCNEGSERVLIYAYMPNRSLDIYIFGDANRREELNWRKRLDIILGIAKGVAYLHEDSGGESVVHRDLKPSNVLLDDDWTAKIADFNTAKLFISDQPESNLTIVVSPGYASPEYALQGAMTLKCDVYSFGVLLLETLSGRTNGPSRRLISYARELCEQHRAMALLDSAVSLPITPPDSEISSELERCIKIGLLCVQEAPDDRPDMSAVVAMLTARNENINRPRAAQQNEAAFA